MRQLAAFVNRRAVDNVQTGTIIAQQVGNPQLYDVQIPNGRTLTLAATSGEANFSSGDYIEITRPTGDQKRAYVGGLAAVVVAGDAFNRILATGVN